MSSAPWLAALDLDGTIVGHDLEIRPRVRATIRAAREAGHLVTIATGRSYPAARPLAALVGLGDGPLICAQGAQIRTPGGIIYERPLSLRAAHETVRWAAARNISVHAYLDDEDFISERHPDTPFYESMHLEARVRAVGDLVAFLDRPPLKLLLIVSAAEAAAVNRELAAVLGDSAIVVRSHARYVEVIHPEVSKGNALLALAAHLGIPATQTLAVGDNHNDLPMLRAAAAGVAMGDGAPEAQAAADWVAPPFVEDGAAHALARFLPGVTLPAAEDAP